MKIVILGAGQVGGSLAEILFGENHDITLVDQDENNLQYFADRLDIRTIRGHCSYPAVLRQAGADSADMLIAVTDNDEANIVACQIAYTLFNVPVKIARLRSRHYFIKKGIFTPEHIPIDVLVSPELIVTKLIAELIQIPGALRVMELAGGVAKIVVLRPDSQAEFLGKTLKEIENTLDSIKFRVVAIYRDHHSLELTPNTDIRLGDRVYIITATENIQKIISVFRYPEEILHRIMITGGGNIGGNLARVLQEDRLVKLIDHNRERCERLAEDLDDVTVLCGDSNDSTLLIDEQVERMDAFLALTNDDEANIIAAIQAKHLGARKTFALINRNDYFNVIEPGAIDVRISPALTTMGAILAHVRQGDVKAVFPIRRWNAEIIEAVVHGDCKTSKLADHLVSEIRFPKATKLIGLIRKDEFIHPENETRIQAEDRVVFLCSNKNHIGELEKLLQVSTGFF